MPVRLEPAVTCTTKTDSKKQSPEKKYKDPLNSWAISALTYSSEIGATVNEIAPKLTFALWVPSFMYLGADIYDKYKNDKDEYSPSSKRAVKESIRQALIFFILPSAATIVGQKMTSPVGKLISDRLSINTRDSIYRHTNGVIEQASDDNFQNKENFKKFLKSSLENHINTLKNTRKNDNIFRKFYRYLTGYFALTDTDSAKIYAFAEKNADKIFDLKNKLQNNVKDEHIPSSIYKKYNSELESAKKLYGKDYADKALRNALQNYQNHLIVKNKIVKTLGGVASCLLLTEPIGYLVNKVLMPQYIAPGVNLINDKLKDSNLIKIHLRKISETQTTGSSASNANGKSLKVLRPLARLHHQSRESENPEHTLHQDT